MTRAGFFSICCLISIAALSWLAAGVPGLLCLIVGAFVSQIDVGWIDQQDAERAEPQPVVANIPIAAQRVSDADARNPHRELKAVGWKRLPLKPSAKVIPLKRKAL